MGRFKMPPQIFRLVLLTLGIIASYIVARTLLTPPSHVLRTLRLVGFDQIFAITEARPPQH